MQLQTYSEENLIPLSALQHIFFCERRAALVHVERIWTENYFTAEGRNLHEKADVPGAQMRGDCRIVRGLHVHSFRLGLIGKMDVVEFRKVESGGVLLIGVEGYWQPRPIEYKRGVLREEDSFKIQLCAQALCLEEMLGVEVPRGDIFFGKSRRRLEIVFDEKLRSNTETAAQRLHEIIDSKKTPKASYEKKCERCSLIGLCMPQVTEGKKSVEGYIKKVLESEPGV